MSSHLILASAANVWYDDKMTNTTTNQRTTGAFQPTPPNSRYLWQVMRAWKLDTFLRGGLWLARLDQFNDPMEGTLPGPNLGLLNNLLPAFQAAGVVREYELGVQRAFASCWHMSEGDPSAHAWETFGSDKDGVAIRTTPEAIRQAILCVADGPIYLGAIRYIDHATDFIPDGNIIEASFVVQRGFHQERESRVLIHTHGTATTDHLYGKNGLFGPLVASISAANSPSGKTEFTGGHAQGTAIVLRVDPRALIQEIFIDPRVSHTDGQAIITIVESYGFGDRLRR